MDNTEGKSFAKNAKTPETLEFFSSHKNMNITISKENYDKLVEQGYPTDHLSKKREVL